MNARELYEIVKDVPREAWPKRISCDSPLREWRLRFYRKSRNDIVEAAIDVEDVELLFEASMARFASTRARKFFGGMNLPGGHLVIVNDSMPDFQMHFAYLLPYSMSGNYIMDKSVPDPSTGEASCKTVVEALAALCKEIGVHKP